VQEPLPAGQPGHRQLLHGAPGGEPAAPGLGLPAPYRTLQPVLHCVGDTSSGWGEVVTVEFGMMISATTYRAGKFDLTHNSWPLIQVT